MEKDALDLLRQAFLMGFMMSGEGFNGEMEEVGPVEVKASGGDSFAAQRKKMEADDEYKKRMEAAMAKLAPAFLAQMDALELRGTVKSAAGATGEAEAPTPNRAPRAL